MQKFSRKEDIKFWATPADCPGLWCVAWGSKTEHDACGPRTIGYYAISLVFSGGGWFESDSQKRRVVAAPSLIFLFPGEEHHYAPNRHWHERWVLFEGPLADWLLKERFIDKRRPVIELEDHRLVLAAFEAIGAMPTYSRHSPVLAAEHIQTIIRGAWSSTAEGGVANADPLVARAIRKLDGASARPPSVAELARELRVSSATLRRRFHAELGRSPKQYVLGRTLARAQELLVASNMPVRDVAAQLGFDDAFYFSRLFRSHFGRSPEQFRREYARTATAK